MKIKRYLSVALALLILFSTAYTSGASYAAPLADGSYNVKAKLMDAANPSNESMAAGALKEAGTLEVINGQWYLTVEFQTVYLFGLAGNASNIRYYQAGLGSTLQPATVVSTRKDAQGNDQVAKVKMPVAVDANGIYIKMSVDAMNNAQPNAYLTFTVDNQVMPTQYTITATAGANGSIEPAGATTVTKGAVQVYSITPANGYLIKDVLVDGQSQGAVDNYTFDNVTADHTITASFEKDVNTASLADGTYNANAYLMRADDISKPSMAAGALAEKAMLEVTDGKWYLKVDFKTLHLMTQQGMVSADASNIRYYQAGLGSPSTPIAPYNTDTDAQTNDKVQQFKIPVAVDAKGVYIMMDVAGVHNDIPAYIAFNIQHSITASAGANGSIEPAGVTTVTRGAVQLYTITPKSGFSVKSVLIDGQNMGAITSYKFTDVKADHTITASFEADSVDNSGNNQLDSVDESFAVYTTMKRANDISQRSMAADAIDSVGLIEIVDGQWYLTVEFKSVNLSGLLGSASEIKYYTDGLGSSLRDAVIVNYRTDANGVRQVREVRMPVDTNAKGIYVNMYVDAMQKATDAYIAFEPVKARDSEENGNQPQNGTNPADPTTGSTEQPTDQVTSSPDTWRYKDVSPQQAFYSAVENLSKKGLLNGTGNGLFTPFALVNRATLTTLLYRIAGEPQVSLESAAFQDVATDQWYSAAISWAKSAGVVKGYSETAFGPEDLLTKEQIVTIIYRFLKPSLTDTVDMTVLDARDDAVKVSAYAREAVAWALMNGILTLDDFGRINPQESITRANMAVIVDRVLLLDK